MEHSDRTASPRGVAPSPPSAKVFVSYRRKDSAGHTGRLVDDLNSRLRDPAFRDLESIRPGVDFREAVEKAVGSCKVLIAVIGRDWSTVTDKSGNRRLDDPSDLVRLEVATALARGDISVIPVLVPDASMPGQEELPPDLVKLPRRNAIVLSDAHWPDDVENLLQTIEEMVPGSVEPLPPARPWLGRLRKLASALVGGFPAPLLIATLLPHQMRGLMVPLSAVGVGLSAVVLEPYLGERLSRPVTTRRFAYALMAVIGLVSFAGLRMVLTETVPSGSHTLNLLTSFGDRAPPPGCPCPKPWDDRECLVRHQNETTFKRCWGPLKTERALLWSAYLVLSAGVGGFAGLVGLRRETRGRQRSEKPRRSA